MSFVVRYARHTVLDHRQYFEDDSLCKGIGYAVLVGIDVADVQIDELLVGIIECYLPFVHVNDRVLPDVAQLVVPVVLHTQTGIDDVVDCLLLDTEEQASEVGCVHVVAHQEIGHAEQEVVLVHLVALLRGCFDTETSLLAHDDDDCARGKDVLVRQTVDVV